MIITIELFMHNPSLESPWEPYKMNFLINILSYYKLLPYKFSAFSRFLLKKLLLNRSILILVYAEVIKS